ncbi:tyrosine-type recombinase/integrase [Saccharothrix texasensis]|uniref:Site-specific recombinase XerD n=1 Tax=Saccharothrix texasensis TaxID=103734 RepID=A0A3N1H8V2_9PSEU|nr:site-specific integrase [Saccharothrix texasensis]ROP38967.1 site-specific recombinase XerD [Saccharothrix texasensis]
MAHRSANGEGSIYRRKDGRYEAALYVDTTSGKRKRLRFYGTTRTEVSAKLTEARLQAQRGVPSPDKNWRVGEYLDHWLDQAVRTKRRPLTYRRSEAIVRLRLKPGLGTYALKGLSVHTIQMFLDRLHATGTTEASLYQIRKVLSAALTYAVRTELLFRNVARLVELPTYTPREAAYWSTKELERFLHAGEQDPLYSMFVMLVLYGLRSGEVRGIRWCDVDFERDELRIRQQVQRIDGALQQVPLKTASSRRDEPLLATAREVLLRQRTKQAVARATAGSSWQGSGDETELVFTTKSGRPIEARNVLRSFRRICAQHEIPLITLHGLRHSNATTQKDLDVPARDIQAILGHGDVKTTGIYEHVDMSRKRAALEKVEGQLFAEDVGDRGRSRQLSRQSHEPTAVNHPGIRTKENTHLCRVGTFFGGSSQTRTGDTRLFRTTEQILQGRITEVKERVKRAERQWMLGAVAVNLAVRVTPN